MRLRMRTRVLRGAGRRLAAPAPLVALLAALGCAGVQVGGLSTMASRGELTLVSNQENTVFVGRVIGGDPSATIVGAQLPGARPDESGMIRLGQGKFVRVKVHPEGVYEIAARPPGYRERMSTIAPPIASRLGFTFEISDRTGHVAQRDEPAEVRVDVKRPVVSVESPAGTETDAASTTVVVTARTASGVSGVTITVNGDPIPMSKQAERTRGPEFSTTQKIPLVPGRNLVHVAVTDRKGRVGYQSLNIDRAAGDGTRQRALAPKSPRARKTYKPNYGRRVAAVIGINDYTYWPGLEGATGDAKRMAAKLRKLGFDDVIELYDRDATRAGILRVLGQELPRKAKREDMVFIFFAGHGQTETLPDGQKRGYIIPVDGTTDGVFSSAISMETLRDLSNRVPAKHVYYAMDSCYSGLGFTRGLTPVSPSDGYIAKITSHPVVQMITAGMEGEEAIERGGQGLFTSYLLRALDGEADMNDDGVVTSGEIGNFVRPGVTNASGQRQTPLYGTIDGNGEVAFFIR